MIPVSQVLIAKPNTIWVEEVRRYNGVNFVPLFEKVH